MSESTQTSVIVTMLVISILLVAIWAFVRWRRSQNTELQRLLRTVSQEALINFFIPDGAGGEIHIDHLLLTQHGLMLLETKDIQGDVFAGDRMDTWSANHQGTRFTFNNPIPMLQARSAAVSSLVPGVPLESRVVFINQATFPKGHPATVSTVATLIEEYSSVDAAEDQTDFSDHWQTIKSAAVFA